MLMYERCGQLHHGQGKVKGIVKILSSFTHHHVIDVRFSFISGKTQMKIFLIKSERILSLHWQLRNWLFDASKSSLIHLVPGIESSQISSKISHKEKIVISRIVHWMVLWGTKNGSSVALHRKPPFGTFTSRSAYLKGHMCIIIYILLCIHQSCLDSGELEYTVWVVHKVLNGALSLYGTNQTLCKNSFFCVFHIRTIWLTFGKIPTV